MIYHFIVNNSHISPLVGKTHVCIHPCEDGTPCYTFFHLVTKKDRVTSAKFQHDAFNAMFETGKASKHLADVHAVRSIKSKANTRSAVHAIAANQPPAKRVKQVEKKTGVTLSSPASEAASEGTSHNADSIEDDNHKISMWLLRGLTPDQVKARRANQRCKTMCFYVYSDQKISGAMLTGPEYRDMLCAGDPQYAKLNMAQAQVWVDLEFELGQFFFEFAVNENRELHNGNPFAQDQHDCVTLANHKKYSAHGMQMIFAYVNWTLCMGFKPCKSGKAPDMKVQCENVWASSKVTRADFGSKIQDFADLAVARQLGFDEEGCQMHCGDKTGSWAVGKLTKSKGKVPVEPFPEGVALMQAMHDNGTFFSYGKRLEELHHCCDVTDSPKLKITVDHNKTRVAAVNRLLGSQLRMNKALKLFRDQHRHEAKVQVSDAQYAQAAEFEGVLDLTRKFTTLVQHEAACNGGYKAKMFELVEDGLDPFSGAVVMYDLEKQTKTSKARRVKTRDELSSIGRKCFDRASQEARRRKELHGSAMCERDFLAAGLDLRLVGRGELTSSHMAKCKSVVQVKYAVYIDDSSADESGAESEVEFKDGFPVFKAAVAKVDKPDFETLWQNWLNLSKQIRWKDLFKGELKHVESEEDVDAIDDLMELDVLHNVYEKIIADKVLSAGVGKLPLLALCYIGNNLASSYCERVNSCAKLIMTHDRTVLNDAHLEKVCWLRMNRTFMTFMKVKYADVAKEWQNKMAAALLDMPCFVGRSR